MTAAYRFTPEQEAEMAALLADDQADQEREQAQREQWRSNRERREADRTVEAGRRPPDPWPWPKITSRSRLVPKRLRTRVPCQARRTNGQPCGAWAIHGHWVCVAHGGAAPQVRAAAQRNLAAAGAAAFAAKMAERLHAQREAAAAVLGEEAAALLARIDTRVSGG